MSGACRRRSVFHVFISNRDSFCVHVTARCISLMKRSHSCPSVPKLTPTPSFSLMSQWVYEKHKLNKSRQHAFHSIFNHASFLSRSEKSEWCNEWRTLLCWGHVGGVGGRVCWFVQVEECCSSVYSGSALCLEQTLGLRLNISPRPCCALCRNKGGATGGCCSAGSTLEPRIVSAQILGVLKAKKKKKTQTFFLF